MKAYPSRDCPLHPGVFPTTYSHSNHLHLVLCQSQTQTFPHCVFMCSACIVNSCLYGTLKHTMGKVSRFENTNVPTHVHNEFSELIKKIDI